MVSQTTIMKIVQITSLKAALQMAERTTAQNEEMKHTRVFVQKAIIQVDKLIELIRDLLDVTKIQAGKLELRKTKFIIGELITECCGDLQINSQTHQLIIEGETDFEIYADRNRLEQVIVNLISNAVKYSPDSEKVMIKVSQLDHAIKIAITGPFSGGSAPMGTSMRDGAKLAIAE